MRHTSEVTRQVLEEYNEMVQNTAYNLRVHLQRIDEKMERFTVENTNTSDLSIDLKDEREVTNQCLRICEDAKSYIESLTNRESPLLREAPQNATEDDMQNYFDAQLLTRRALDVNGNTFAEIIGRLRERLECLVLNEGPRNDSERVRLQEDINSSKQCLEVCKVAGEVARRKIYRIGEVIADGDSDQVVVTTLADLFDIKTAVSKGSSAQLVGSMTDDTLRNLTDKRYSSRFGALARDSDPPAAANTKPPSDLKPQRSSHTFSPQTDDDEQSPGPKTSRNRPSPNEMRKRVMDDATYEERC